MAVRSNWVHYCNAWRHACFVTAGFLLSGAWLLKQRDLQDEQTLLMMKDVGIGGRGLPGGARGGRNGGLGGRVASRRPASLQRVSSIRPRGGIHGQPVCLVVGASSRHSGSERSGESLIRGAYFSGGAVLTMTIVLFVQRTR